MNETQNTIDRHAPDPAFREYLESEVVVACRRGRTLRRLRYAAVILVSAGIGMTANMASAQVRDRSQRDSILTAAQGDAIVAIARVAVARKQLDEDKRAYDVGARSKDAVVAAELQVKEAEVEYARISLNVQETTASSLPARDDLNAPLVDGKDYVLDRLRLQLGLAQQRFELADYRRGEAARRVRAAAASMITELEADVAMKKAQGALMVLAARQRAREDFLTKNTAIDELNRSVERATVTAETQVAVAALDLATQRAALIKKQKDVGAVGELDLLRAELEIKERQLELRQLQERLKAIR